MRQPLAWGWGCALLLALPGCQRDSAEQRLRKDMAALQEAVEEHRLRDAMAGVADDFAGEAGMDRAALHNLLRAQFLANARIGVNTGPLSIALQGDDATVRFDAVVSGGDARLLPERMQRYEVVTGWREQDGRWRLRHAQWSAAP
ncbi:nuclear transport factor 2 family protein [Xanthomonas bundabergensis]|uniref:nuclear transport factor 2 family protein n=1 Tax=Xanthomonas bundabergensis TaxID=3160842 RepID=UPI00351722BF